jgi:dihydroorotate dehydrogenase (NAD+) catalytic subunit
LGLAGPQEDARRRRAFLGTAEAHVNLAVRVGPLDLRNPVILASGTFGYGWELRDFFDYSAVGAVIVKTVTPRPRKGNPPPRTCETASGVLNAIGLPNGGIEQFLKVGLPYLEKLPTRRIASIAGETVEEFAALARTVSETGSVDAIEVNVSCPNVERGSCTFGADPEATKAVARAVKAASRVPIIVKLTPNVTSIAAVAVAAQEGGADILSGVNTFLGMAVDWRRAGPVLGNVTGGLSGPAIKPLALRMVMEMVGAVKIPVIGIGGISSGRDALEFLTLGARAVEVGTATLVEPAAPLRIVAEMEAELAAAGFDAVEPAIGRFKIPDKKR